MSNIILNFLPLSSLRDLIEGLSFSHKGGEERSNEHWAVRTRIWSAEKPNCFDATVDIAYLGNDSPRLDGIELDIAPCGRRVVTEATGQAWTEDLPYGEYVVHPVPESADCMPSAAERIEASAYAYGYRPMAIKKVRPTDAAPLMSAMIAAEAAKRKTS